MKRKRACGFASRWVLSWLAVAGFYSGAASSQPRPSGLSPILKLEAAPFHPPYLQQILRDEALYDRPLGIQDVGHLDERLQRVQAMLSSPQSEWTHASMRRELDDLLVQGYYWGDVVAGRSAAVVAPAQAQAEWKRTRQLTTAVAEKMRSQTSQQQERVYLDYVVVTMALPDPQTYARGVQQLNRMQSLAGLSAAKVFQLELVRSLVQARNMVPEVRARGVAFLRRHSHHPNPYVASTANLAVAHYLSRYPGEQSDEYRGLLGYVSSTCGRHSQAERSSLLRQVLGIWQGARDFSAQWDRPPFSTSCFAKDPQLTAVMERVALEHWRRDRLDRAARLYQQVHEAVPAGGIRRLLNQRLVEIERLIYLRSDDFAAYHKRLTDAEQTYPDSSYALALGEYSFELVDRELEKARRVGASREQMSRAELLTKTFLATRNFTRHHLTVGSKLAEAYKTHGMHRKASEKFEALYRELQAPGRKDLLKQAIVQQAMTVPWDLNQPFGHTIKGDSRVGRERLYALLGEYLELTGERLDWGVVGNLARLALSLERRSEAFALLRPVVVAQPKHRYAPQAVGALLAAAERSGEWHAVVEIATLAQDLKLQPVDASRPLDVAWLHELGVFQVARLAHQDKDYPKAYAAYASLVTRYPQSPRLSTYLYMQGECHYDGGAYDLALTDFKAVIAAGPRDGYFEKALLQVGRLAKGMGQLDEVIATDLVYLRMFPGGPEADKLRLELAEVYLAVGKVERALQITAEMGDSVGMEPELERVRQAVLTAYENRSEAGERQRLVAALLEQPGFSPSMKARVLMIEAKAAFEAGDPERLDHVEAGLLGLGQRPLAVTDALSYVEYARVALSTAQMHERVKELFMQHTPAAVDTIRRTYQQIKAAHLGVCKDADAAHCVVALEGLRRVADQYCGTLENVQAQEGEGAAAYRDAKEVLVEFLHQDMKTLGNQMLAKARLGNTAPTLTANLLWRKSHDWNFSQNPSSGVGFVQLRELTY